MSDLDAWYRFYVILGSAAGALSRFQFVVVTLVAPSLRVVEAGPACREIVLQNMMVVNYASG
jgi:hypothetical protein